MNSTSCSSKEKKVSFEGPSSIETVHETMHIEDYTIAERQTCWMSATELSKSRSEVKSMARKLSKKKNQHHRLLSDDQESTSTGFELYCSEEQQRQRQVIRNRAQQAVFEEQEFQWMMPSNESEQRIAMTYQKHTIQCQHQAQKVGKAFEKEAEAVYFPSSKRHHTKSFRRLCRSNSPIFTRAKSIRFLSSRR